MIVLILHAIESHAGAHWQQWLASELAKQAHTVLMPDLPEAARPDRKTWLATVQDLLAHTATGDLVLVAHSLGVVTALDYIEQSQTDVRGLISVAGFGKNYGLELNSYFMLERDIDFFTVRQKVREKYVFYGDNDPYVPQAVLADLAAKLDVAPTVVHGGGHLNTEAGFTTFPELLTTLRNIQNES